MTDDYASVYETLHQIYQKHRRRYRKSFDSKQMCSMWSTSNPPDIIEGTPPIYDMENAFDITIDDDTALELYDMHLDEAARKIVDMRTEQGQQ